MSTHSEGKTHLQLDDLDRGGKGGKDPGAHTLAFARPRASLLPDLQLVVKGLAVQRVNQDILESHLFTIPPWTKVRGCCTCDVPRLQLLDFWSRAF